MKKLPSYRLHKSSNQAVCWISGRTYYLGEFGTKESQDKFNRLIAEYLTNPSFGVEKCRQSVAESVVVFLRHAESYYGESELFNFRRALTPLIELYADLNISEFGIEQFKAVRDYWVKRDAARVYANRQSGRVIAFVKWLVAEGVLSPIVHQAIKCVAPLKAGRCSCRESEAVKPVDDKTVKKTLKFLTPILKDMVRLQSVIGCRPGELCQLKPGMVDTSGSVWVITLEHHKTAWRGHKRQIYVGPKGQAILKPYLGRNPEAFCFSPTESVEQRLQIRASKRTTAMSCGHRRGSNRQQDPKRKPGLSFTTGSYGRAIAYACKQAGLPVWSPNQLRHAVATRLRDVEGIESASLILGHRHLATSEIYAEQSERKALEVAKKHG